MNTVDHAANIRKTLKSKHNISSRQVSVRADSFSMGSAIRVRINDANIAIDVVKAIASSAESIRRCEISGEILSGGNRYLSVSYSQDALDAIAARWLGAVDAAAIALLNEPEYLHEVPGTSCKLAASRHGLKYGFAIWADGHFVAEVCDAQNAAQTIGIHMLNVEAGVL